MSDRTPPIDDDVDDRLIGGHTLDELADYLDRGREPRDPSIEDSPACRIALDSLARLRSSSRALIDADAAAEPAGREPDWVARVLDSISLDAHAGRDIGLLPTDPDAELFVTEGALRARIRAVADDIPGLLVRSVRLDGDLHDPAAPLHTTVDVHMALGVRLPDAARALRVAVARVVLDHTLREPEAVDVVVSDLVVSAPAADARDGQP